MIYGKSDIKEYFRKIGKKYFALYKKSSVESGNAIFKTDEDADSNTDDAFRSFEEVLNMLRTGEYTLICNNDPKVSNRGSNRVDFRISMEDSLAAGSKEAVTGIGSVSGPVDYETMLSKAKLMASEEFEKLMAKKDLEETRKINDDLKKELKEATSRVEDPWNKFIGALAPHAEGIVGGLMGKPAVAAPQLAHAVSGITPDLHLDENATEAEVNAHAQKVFEDFASALQTAKPNEWLQILVQLTNLIKNNPRKFDTALTFL